MKLTVKIKEVTRKTGSGFEGTTQVPGLSSAKVARVKDGTTLFSTTGTLRSAARALGKRLSAEVEFVDPVKKAAKKSVKAKTKPTVKKATKSRTKLKTSTRKLKTSTRKPKTSVRKTTAKKPTRTTARRKTARKSR